VESLPWRRSAGWPSNRRGWRKTAPRVPTPQQAEALGRGASLTSLPSCWRQPPLELGPSDSRPFAAQDELAQ